MLKGRKPKLKYLLKDATTSDNIIIPIKFKLIENHKKCVTNAIWDLSFNQVVVEWTPEREINVNLQSF